MPATVRILIVEDDPQDAALAEREVRRADIFCTFRRVETSDGMAEALREFVPDVILTDHSLPAFDARSALQLAQQLSPGTPVIVVTGRLGDEPAVQYLQAGAADYIVKDHLHRLGPAVLRALDTKRSRQAQARAHQLQTAIYRIAQVAMSTPGLRDLLPVVHQIVGELMPAKNFYIALHDAASDLLSFPYFVDEHDTDFSSKKPGKGLTEYVLRTGQALLVTPEVQAELERQGEVELVGAPSIDWLGVPLKIGDRTIGVLVVQTYAPGVRYGQRENEILQFVSTQVAMAIERSHAEAELRTSESRLKAIIDAALDAVITMDGDGVIRSWSPQAERVFGWPASEAVGGPLSRDRRGTGPEPADRDHRPASRRTGDSRRAHDHARAPGRSVVVQRVRARHQRAQASRAAEGGAVCGDPHTGGGHDARRGRGRHPARDRREPRLADRCPLDPRAGA